MSISVSPESSDECMSIAVSPESSDECMSISAIECVEVGTCLDLDRCSIYLIYTVQLVVRVLYIFLLLCEHDGRVRCSGVTGDRSSICSILSVTSLFRYVCHWSGTV